MNEGQLLLKLNARTKEDRLAALREIAAMARRGEVSFPPPSTDTNNHVHTTFSFSSYSPTAAIYQAKKCGLCTVGIVDHDSIAGADEFLEAGRILGITTTVGAEVRVSFTGTPLEGKTFNNPDEPNVAYIALHGVPHNNIAKLDDFLAKVRDLRNERNKKQIAKLNEVIAPYGISISFEDDVVPLSMAKEGGSITERHILFALTQKLIEKYGRGQKLLDFIVDEIGIAVAPKVKDMLLDTSFHAYGYDVLNVLKSEFVPKFFISGGNDSLPVKEVVDFARSLSIIPTYCYLGDVAESPTGDKKAQKFEDEYLDEVLTLVKNLGFEAIAYMPSRNTMDQLRHIIAKCGEYGFMEISGEDINQPRQNFICEKLREPEFSHLEDSTWALVGHEYIAEKDPDEGIYSEPAKRGYPDMASRVKHFSEIGRTAVWK